MAGKIIVYAPTETNANVHFEVYINGIKQEKILLTGDSATFKIDGKAKIRGKTVPNHGFTTESEDICVSDNTTTKIAFSLKSGFPKVKLIGNIVGEETYLDDPNEQEETAVYDLIGARGRRLIVYKDKCIIKTVATVTAFLTGNGSDGEKTIYYADVLGVQYKRSGLQLGYLQLETASSTMNNRTDNFFNENSFTFDSNLDITMEDVQKYVKQKVDEAKKQRNAPVVVAGAVSSADELKKFKELLDMGVITQEEFDAKKKQLLGL